MAELRALFLISDSNIIFSQRYYITEKKVQMLTKQQYHQLPNDDILIPIFKELISLQKQKNQLDFKSDKKLILLENRKETVQQTNKNVYQKSKWFDQIIEIKNLRLICHLSQIVNNYVLITIPLIRQYYLEQKSDLDQLLGYSLTLDILIRFSNQFLVYVVKYNLSELDTLDLEKILNHLVPYGKIYDNEFEITHSIVSQLNNRDRNKDINQEQNIQDQNDKVAQYQQMYYVSDQSSIYLFIDEYLNHQSFSNKMSNFSRVSGKISGQFQFKPNTEVTFQIKSKEKELINSIKLSTEGKMTQTEDNLYQAVQISLNPHLFKYKICEYHSKSNHQIPFEGIFQKKEIDSNHSLLFFSLFVNENHILQSVTDLKAIFTVKVGWSITNTDIKVQVGNVKLSQNRNGQDIMVWSIGKVTQTELNLSGEWRIEQIHNQKYEYNVKGENYVLEDEYVQIYFNLQNQLFSELIVKEEDIQLYPNQEVQSVRIQKYSQTHKYIIYNNLMDRMVALEL